MTHFRPREAVAIGPPPRPPPAKARPRGEKRAVARQRQDDERRKAVRLRRDLGDSIPEGYESLFR